MICEENLRWLLAEAVKQKEQLQADNAKLKEALKVFADRKNWWIIHVGEFVEISWNGNLAQFPHVMARDALESSNGTS